MQNAAGEIPKQKQSGYVHTEVEAQLRKVHSNIGSCGHTESHSAEQPPCAPQFLNCTGKEQRVLMTA